MRQEIESCKKVQSLLIIITRSPHNSPKDSSSSKGKTPAGAERCLSLLPNPATVPEKWGVGGCNASLFRPFASPFSAF